MLGRSLLRFERLGLLVSVVRRVDGRSCCRFLTIVRLTPAGKLGSAASTVLQSFEFFVRVSQVLVLRLILRDCIGSIAIDARLARAFCRSLKALLQERYWRIMCQVLLLAFVHSLGSCQSIPTIVHHLFLEVQELALEAWVGVDHASF